MGNGKKQTSRKRNVVRNSIYSLLSFVFTTILALVVRKLFVEYLKIEYLGLEGLFSSILGLFALAEMGVSGIISYNLYKEIAARNEKEINILMSIYRYMYMLIGIVVSVAGIAIFFSLPLIIHEKSVPWNYVQVVYILQLAAVVSSYFLAYRRTLYIADQKEYICIRIDTVLTIVKNVLQLGTIVILKNYLLYAAILLFTNVLANIIIFRRCKKTYAFLKAVKITKQDMRDRNVFKDIGNFLAHKISYLVYSSTDNIILSIFLGLRITGIVANYTLLSNKVYQILYKTLQGIIPSIGNMVYSENIKKTYSVYSMLDLFYFIVGSIVACVYITCLQPFMLLFFGNDFLLPYSYVICLAINVHIGMQFENAWNFRSTYGKYENDRKYMMLSAVINLVLSIVLVKFWGVTGIIIGTIFGLLFIVYGRAQFVFRIILKKSLRKYIVKHLLWSLVTVGEIFIVSRVTGFINSATWLGLILKGFLSLFLILCFQLLLFFPSTEFKNMFRYVRNMLESHRERRKL